MRMRAAKIWSSFLLAIMTIALIYGVFIHGHFWTEGAVIVDLVWGKLTLVDFYVGVALFAGWVIFREASKPYAILWIIGICLLGNWASALYVLLALRASKGDWRKFWFGAKAHTI